MFRYMSLDEDPMSCLLLQEFYKRSHPKSRTVSGKPLTSFANTLAKHLDAMRDYIYFSYSPLNGTLWAAKMRPMVAVFWSPVLRHGFFHHHTSVQGGPDFARRPCMPAQPLWEEALLQSSSPSWPPWKEQVSEERHSSEIQVWENRAALWWGREVALQRFLLNPNGLLK